MTECCIDYKINMSQQGDDCQKIKEKKSSLDLHRFRAPNEGNHFIIV